MGQHADAILNFLYDHIDRSIDSQVRARWEPNTVVLWDNRVTAHVGELPVFRSYDASCILQSAILDFIGETGTRHGVRITPQAERPIPANPDLKVD